MPNDEPSSSARARRYTALIGAAALIAWFVLIWFMFADVF